MVRYLVLTAQGEYMIVSEDDLECVLPSTRSVIFAIREGRVSIRIERKCMYQSQYVS